MIANGYSFVPEPGFIAFGRELEDGAWKDVDVSPWDGGTTMKGVMAGVPLVVACKIRLLFAIRTLAAVGEDMTVACGAEWNSAERAFNLGVGTAEEHKSPLIREAAGRVRLEMLSGGGTAQTGLRYEQKVDYGRNQVRLGAAALLSEDIDRIGVKPHLDRIGEATEALAAAIGRSGQGRTRTRARRLRDGLAACSIAFNAAHDAIAWAIAIANAQDREAREWLQALLAPFEALLARYPAPGAAASEPDGLAEPEPDKPALTRVVPPAFKVAANKADHPAHPNATARPAEPNAA